MEYQMHVVESEVEEVEQDTPANTLELIIDNILKECVYVPTKSGKHPVYVC